MGPGSSGADCFWADATWRFGRAAPQCFSMPARSITPAHFLMSACNCASTSAGVLAYRVDAKVEQALLDLRVSKNLTERGIERGNHLRWRSGLRIECAFHDAAEKPFTPCSAAVLMSGSAGEGCGPAQAMARN